MRWTELTWSQREISIGDDHRCSAYHSPPRHGRLTEPPLLTVSGCRRLSAARRRRHA